MTSMFVDMVSGQFFMADYIKVRQLLNRIERESEHEGYRIKWDEYFEGLNLPKPWWCIYLPIMGRVEHRYRIKFKLSPCQDEDDGGRYIRISAL